MTGNSALLEPGQHFVGALGRLADGRHAPATAVPLRVTKESGCTKALPKDVTSGKTVYRTLVSGDLKRTYRLHVPAKASTTSPMPLVLNFHGRTGNGADHELSSGLVPVSERESFLLVSPDGVGTPTGWSAGATPANSVDDVKFASDLLDTLMREFCLDASKVYATGFSNGAFMASKLACALPDRITAIAAVGGVDYLPEGCAGRVPVLAFHGLSDPIVPAEGGLVRGWQYQGAYNALREWSGTNGCSDTATITDLAAGVTMTNYDGCAAATRLVTIDGAGHVWPGSPVTKTTEPVGSISAAELIWSFFSASKRAA